MSQKVLEELEESYDSLWGLGIMMDIETLKCNSQWPNSIHVLAMLINFMRHIAFLIYLLRYLYDNFSYPGVNGLLYFAMALVNFSSKNGLYFITCLLGISSSKSKSI